MSRPLDYRDGWPGPGGSELRRPFGCTRRCLPRAGVLGSLTRPAVRGVGGGFRSKVASEAPADRVDAAESGASRMQLEPQLLASQ